MEKINKRKTFRSKMFMIESFKKMWNKIKIYKLLRDKKNN